MKGDAVPARRPRDVPDPQPRRDGRRSPKSLDALLKANHRQQDDFRLDDVAARMQEAAEPGRRLQHHLHALGRPVADRRRHGQREHPDGDAEGARARGRRQDGDRRLRPRGLQGVHDRGAAPDRPRQPRRASSIGVAFSKIITSSLGVPLYMEPEELPLGATSSPRSSASSSRSTRPSRRAACRRWRRCAMSSDMRRRLSASCAGDARAAPRAGSRSARTSRSTARSSAAASSSCGRTSCARS